MMPSSYFLLAEDDLSVRYKMLFLFLVAARISVMWRMFHIYRMTDILMITDIRRMADIWQKLDIWRMKDGRDMGRMGQDMGREGYGMGFGTGYVIWGRLWDMGQDLGYGTGFTVNECL